MPFFISSILALVVGPLVAHALLERRRALVVLDGFVVTALIGLLGLHLLPEALSVAGGYAAIATVIGFVLPSVFERYVVSQRRISPLLLFAMAGLAVHAMLDGAALHGAGRHEHAKDGIDSDWALALAVILHRLPLGLTVWWAVHTHSKRVAYTIFATIIAATTVGYFGSDVFFRHLPEVGLATFQALVAGSVLHVVIDHGPDVRARGRTERRLSAGGALTAGVVLLTLGAAHPDNQRVAYELDAAHTFATLAFESAPALLFAFLFAGLASSLIGRGSLRWLGRGRPATQAVKGVAFGLPLPVCSCGVLPMYQGLVQRGGSVAASMAFLVATPEVGLDAILLSVPLLGSEMTVARVVCAGVVALVVGTWVGGRVSPTADTGLPSERPPTTLRQRIVAGLRFGFIELVDHVGPWILAGLALAALLEPSVDASALSGLPFWLTVPAMALLGMPLYVCASGATPLVAVLIHKGLGAGGAIAFLLTGPATNITTFGVLKRLHGTSVAIRFAVGVGVVAVLLGYAVEGFSVAAEPALALHEAAHAEPTWLQIASLTVLVVAFFASLLRQGPRGVLSQVLNPHGHHHDDGCEHHHHDHDHHHHHHHDHDHHDHRHQ
ncbi:MAG: permease [Myxococcota bacterium]